MKRIYLDNAATTPMLPEVKEVINAAVDTFGNASSLHYEGCQASKAINEARAYIAKSTGAKPSEIIFTSGGSEANNMVVNTFAAQNIAVSAIEHPSILEPAKKYGAEIIAVNKIGQVEKINNLQQVDLVSIMFANNEIGTIENIKQLTIKAHQNGALLHTDASQAFGKVPIDVNKLGVDYLTISGHKIGGPKGIGVLYVRESSPIKLLILGGHQENNLRAGTENTLAIIGLVAAIKNYNSTGLEVLRAKLRDGILHNIPGVTINGDQKNCLPNILNVTFAGVEGESVMLKLDATGIAVSTGSACATGDIKSSHVLMAIGADPEKAHGSIRFSFGPANTIADVEEVLKVLPLIVSDLRKISTIGGNYE